MDKVTDQQMTDVLCSCGLPDCAECVRRHHDRCDGVQLKPGWLQHQFGQVKKQVSEWPQWMKMEAGINMMEPTPQQMVEALAQAAGWKPGTFFLVQMVMPGGHLINPLQKHDDAIALQEKLCGDAGFRDRFVMAACAVALGEDSYFLLSISPADRCRVLYEALPEEQKNA